MQSYHIFSFIKNLCLLVSSISETELPNHLAIPPLGIYLEELKPETQTKSMCIFTAAVFTLAKR